MIFRVTFQKGENVISFNFDNCETAASWAETGAYYSDQYTHICVDIIHTKEEN